MTQPLALLLYEKLLPGTQLVNRLQDLGWRVQTLHESAALVPAAEKHKPLLLLADLSSSNGAVVEEIARVRQNPGTAHLPVIAFSADETAHAAAVKAGANLVVTDAAILPYLNQFIEQVLSEF
jgi:CheY-like chemotaxis protein